MASIVYARPSLDSGSLLYNVPIFLLKYYLTFFFFFWNIGLFRIQSELALISGFAREPLRRMTTPQLSN